MARFAENPFMARFRYASRLFKRNGTKPDKVRTDRTADKFVPMPSLSYFSPDGVRCIISRHHNVVRSLSFRTHCSVSARKLLLLCSRHTSPSSFIIVSHHTRHSCDLRGIQLHRKVAATYPHFRTHWTKNIFSKATFYAILVLCTCVSAMHLKKLKENSSGIPGIFPSINRREWMLDVYEFLATEDACISIFITARHPTGAMRVATIISQHR